MADIYLHGVETTENTNGPRPVMTIDTGVIGLIGTAPDASDELWPLDTVRPIYGANGAVQGLGANGTLKDAIEGIFDQAGRVSQTVLVVRVQAGANINETMSKIIGSSTAFTGMHALRKAPGEHGLTPKLLVAPGFTANRPTDGIKSIAKQTDGVGYTSAPAVAITGGGGHGAEAIAVINSETGKLDEIVMTKPGYGYTSAPSVTLTGGGATTQATAQATVGTVANPVTVELLTLANRFRAGVIKDSLATTTSAAIADRLDYDTDRLLIIEPMGKIFKDAVVVSEPASARIAGLQARIDYSEGFWVSPSNHVVEGIVGVSRPIEHSITDPAAESQLLNRNAIAAIVRSPSGGFKLWGSRVPSSDSLKVFWSVRRAHDTIIDSIERAAEPFIDKPFGLQILVDIAETVNSALRRWKGLGATLGGRVWLDASLNTKETWANGQIFISYDAEAPAPIEHITFIFNRNTGYYEELSARAVREIARMAGTALPAA
ncbi:phage tail sheath subtilisin-like domain-containing protein [Agrobacterium tumefaciens]|uniref:phage tail sheath subtilisin-like domain-containing protein n=1 Tax=Agrobacterium tumefaciens TaxID=358 RepID=UPI0015737862|nr:phage tail sheath subtilisin-like domain-containing protein [Agrobacterium tumefaciens]NTD85500.1 phage tail protein [Agrobacterium tumefaciens]NTD90849.1 phage tail protein [Agrobacterium tumefaciens]NTE03671.1 phage tail protein [Agrobacterium tumefaciens]NTE15923.1 phage tail protein [Agrobacterium tumefaciens]NTE26497.1 phage tail protein [Agrobacterium tumefaciens]